MKGKTKPNKGIFTNDSGKPTAVDLFCGCGGLTVGLKRSGFRVLGAVDVDPLSIKTYKANHRDVTLWEKDIRELDPQELADALGLEKASLDLLAGCPPCQGFSTMRTLNGAFTVDDPRNDLLLEFERFVEALRPRAVMMENVPGLADDRRFDAFLRKLEKLGYLGDHRVLNAAEYGVPQRRRRLIYLAGLGMKIPFAEKAAKMKTVEEAIGGLPKAGRSGDPVHDMPENRTPKVLKIIRLIPKDGGSRRDLPEGFQLDCHKRCNGFNDVYGRMAWKEVAPTITSGCFNPSKGRFLHPEENRAITMREAALLQGFPRRYKFPLTDNKCAVALMIGNALPPPFIRAHAHVIRKTLLERFKFPKTGERA
ncbi:MAG: DNA cytosine methyltransferase [Lentisphaerae bacterium]|nr:DNA cytosine methyltransferase [Lentisphaerota bacterium]